MTALERLALYLGEPEVWFYHDREWLIYGNSGRIGTARGCQHIHDWRTSQEALARAELTYRDRIRPDAIASQRGYVESLRAQLAAAEAKLAALEAVTDLMSDVDPPPRI